MRKSPVAPDRNRSPPNRPGALQGEYRRAARYLRTVRDLVRFAVTRFEQEQLHFGHGTDNALDEAVYLVAYTLRLPLDQATAFMEAVLLPEEVAAVLRMLQRRARERLPASYLTHEAWIGSNRFYVDERVIVPRSYIGHWLEDGVAPWIDEAKSQRVLELCTGSGCLAILLARALPAASIDAVDISPDALKVAARNVADYGLADRIQLMQGELFAPVAGQRYQLIVANPPYVTQRAMRTLPAEYLHEPRIALAGGADGLELVRRILASARGHLTPNGLLVMEVGHARSELERAFPRMSFTWLEIDGVDDAVLLLRREQLAPRRADR